MDRLHGHTSAATLEREHLILLSRQALGVYHMIVLDLQPLTAKIPKISEISTCLLFFFCKMVNN